MTTDHFLAFTRADWAQLAANAPLELSESDLAELQGISDPLSLNEIREGYLPLAGLIGVLFDAARQRRQALQGWLGRELAPVPLLIGVTGSVAVGKSTTARVLRRLLAADSEHREVRVVTTDGFLFSNAVLEERGLSERKGFPETYDQAALLEFAGRARSGADDLRAPAYSHLHYDVMPGEYQNVGRPDILIVEGLGILHATAGERVSELFDLSVYVDAEENLIRQWFMERFARLRETAFRERESFFRRFADMSLEEAMGVATWAWEEINAVNLREHILPVRERADLVLRKGEGHRVERALLRL